MELYHNQVTREQGPFSLRMFHRSWGILMIQQNISAPTTVLDFPTREAFEAELKANSYDIVGISSIIVNVHKVAEMCRIVRRVSPRSVIVIGGHVAAIPDVDKMIDADFIVRGDGISWMRRYLGEDDTAPIHHPEIVSGFDVRAMGFKLPERIHSIAERVQKRGTLEVVRFDTKGELKRWAKRIGKAYNQAFVNNWEYVPLTDREIDFVVGNILTIADPRLIKVIAHENEAVGFLFGFPDLSAAIQRNKGRLFPFGIFDLLREMKRTEWVALNGAGILPEFQGRGGNALLYAEMEKTFSEFHFKHADLTQVAETAVQMRQDLVNVGGVPYKNHRVFQRTV